MEESTCLFDGVVLAVLLVPSVRAQSPEGRKAISHPAPPYPELAKKYGVKGTVKVEVVIAPDGRIKEMKVIGGHPMLVASVEDTPRNWKYAPASSDSTAVLDFDFRP